jgi:protoheme IX farnesyltransferase
MRASVMRSLLLAPRRSGGWNAAVIIRRQLSSTTNGTGTDAANPAVAGAAGRVSRKVVNPLYDKIKQYGELAKFRLSSLVVFTSGAGYALAGSSIDLCTMLATCVGTALCAASAGTFNQIIEIERDASMKRTCHRPLPSGKITPTAATVFGASTAAAGTSLLLAATNPTVAALGAFNIFLYSVPYTLSKQHSEINTWIGSVVGAIPPVMGYAAATAGTVLAAEPMALGSLLFLWQFPHFFALSWMHRQDYARGNFQMVAVNDALGQRSGRLILDYSLLLTALPIVVSAADLTSWMFAVEGSVVNAYLLSLAYAFKQDPSNAKARKVFLCSLWYLPLLLMAFVFHSRNWNKDKLEDKEAIAHSLVSDKVDEVRDTLKGLCLHEMLINDGTQTSAVTTDGRSNDKTHVASSGSHSHLCVKLKADEIVEHSAEVIGGTVVVAAAKVVNNESKQ